MCRFVSMFLHVSLFRWSCCGLWAPEQERQRTEGRWGFSPWHLDTVGVWDARSQALCCPFTGRFRLQVEWSSILCQPSSKRVYNCSQQDRGSAELLVRVWINKCSTRLAGRRHFISSKNCEQVVKGMENTFRSSWTYTLHGWKYNESHWPFNKPCGAQCTKGLKVTRVVLKGIGRPRTIDYRQQFPNLR